MKILYITTKATYGGVQTHIKQCAEFMKNNGHVVSVMAHPNKGEGLENDLRELGVTFYSNKFLVNSFNPIRGIFTIKEIRKVLKSFQPDIVSCHSSSAGFWGRLAVMNKVPVIFTAHGWGFTEGVTFYRSIIIKIAEGLVSSLCRKIICVSDNDYTLALKYNITKKDKLITIHNGVNVNEVKNKHDGLLNFKFNNKIPIVFVGRFTYGKNPEQLIEAYFMLSKNLQESAHIYIIGDGEKRKIIEDIISSNNLSKNVSLVGELSHLDVLNFLYECINSSPNNVGIFSLISLYEGFPRSILEAMGFGFSIIASDVGGVREAVTKDVGILVERNNVKSIHESLEFFLNNIHVMKSFGENAKKRIMESFSLEKMLIKTEEVYKSVL
jgi:glycosyltransferase involved in cell wall biosynthesis